MLGEKRGSHERTVAGIETFGIQVGGVEEIDGIEGDLGGVEFVSDPCRRHDFRIGFYVVHHVLGDDLFKPDETGVRMILQGRDATLIQSDEIFIQ